ncbi:MAG TPA: hypothetical protein VM618_06065, partial [Acidimicrobiia bacterium]|nr:hypothetical protein [Acidimicrobiia bacterium]
MRTPTWLRAAAVVGALVFGVNGSAWAGPGNGQGNAYGHGNTPHSSDRHPSATEDTDADGVANTPDLSGDADNQHPSGNDRHAEAGGSGNQGKAASDPDGDANGGVDQPGHSGGVDQYDQDGNNGCGNDDDFEDDNRGRCLGRRGGDTSGPELVVEGGSESRSTESTGDAGDSGDTSTAEQTDLKAIDGSLSALDGSHASRMSAQGGAVPSATLQSAPSPAPQAGHSGATVLGARLDAAPIGVPLA